ncbi:MAG: hypothetical protein NTY75_01935 [Candidatus Shapirobacteria bacterium]|nr:hypothetical protein [Candidatus Shapirobacteria bacterium]
MASKLSQEVIRQAREDRINQLKISGRCFLACLNASFCQDGNTYGCQFIDAIPPKRRKLTNPPTLESIIS